MQGTSHFRGLAHIAIQTKDLDASIEFYRKHLDFALAYRTTVAVEGGPEGFFPVQYALVERGSCVLELLQPADTGMVKPGQEGIVSHFALDVDDLDAVVAKLKEKGLLERNAAPDAFPDLLKGCRSISVTGPSGERVELFESRR